jgi:hypothetical protein
MIYQRTFPFSGVFIMPGEIGPISGDGGWGRSLGGDADDYGNGRVPVVREPGRGASNINRESIFKQSLPLSSNLVPGS